MAKLQDMLQREFYTKRQPYTVQALDNKILTDRFIAMDVILWLIPIAGVAAFFTFVFWAVGILRL